MSEKSPRLLRLLVLAALACLPLSAQLDPRLQSSTTDFLDLYQQSTNTKVKPEILTIFDFSGSMQALMFHPLYVNSDTQDSDSSHTMSFAYSASTSFTIYAYAYARTAAYTRMTATVGGAPGSATTASSSGYVVAKMTTAATSIVAGTAYTFNASVTSGSDARLKWACTGGYFTSVSDTQAVWVAPSVPSVTATLANGDSTVGTITSTQLVKPDGTFVTLSDAAAASSSSGLYGAGAGSSDVRNWVRAASHVRFQITHFPSSSSGTLRTVDIPIPWKITDADSTGNPLSSETVYDKQTVTKSDGTATTYGSLGNIEMDTTYALSSGSYNLSGSSGTATSTTLSRVDYKQTYVKWLFTGTYPDGSYSGKYVVFDALNASLAGGQSGYPEWGRGCGASAASGSILVPTYNLDGTYAGTETTQAASINIVPALNRVQAVKRAAIKTWISHQADVIWAFRFLDPSGEAGSGSATTINNASTTTIHSSLYGNDSGWRLLNGRSVTNMALIASKLDSGATPLTYAMARGLAQFTDPDSVFEAVETGSDAPSQCMNHFLILFTDGIDNNGTGTSNTNGTTPYLSTANGVTSFSAKSGNTAILANTNLVNRSGSYWNLFTFAGVAAHMSNSSLGTVGTNYMAAPASYTTSSSTPSSFLPFAIKTRGSVQFAKDHRITTMTVGVSLGGKYTDSSSPKRSLFLAATVGDPSLTSWPDISTLKPFEWDSTLNSGNGGRVSGSIYYFDANTPDTLSTSLAYAIESAVAASNINTATVPDLPYVGASLGSQIYVGKFQPPKNGGSIWGGDLLMFNTRLSSNSLQIMDASGDATTTLDSSTAFWSALSALKTTRLWSARKLYTRIPGTSATPEPGLTAFKDTGTTYTDGSTGLKNLVAQGTNAASYAAGSTAQKDVIRFVMGGNLDGTLDSDGRPTTNRSNIMGDIIGSSPTAIEYNFADVSGSLTSRLASVGGDRFRLILVGTNQGWLHAFGEVTKATTVTDSSGVSRTLRTGAVDELWSFMPTDFLENLDLVTISTNPHRFMVDGTPVIYHLDLPPTSGGSADGKVEITSSPGPERVVAVFGLGKGGRSYYAIDLADPFDPELKWSLVPDEAAYFPATRILDRTGKPTLAQVQSVLAKMGFSTCTPAIGRTIVTSSPGNSSTSVVRDVLFLGGGFSVPEVEANFTDSSGSAIPLGRSVLALDVYTGKVIAAVDMQTVSPDDSGKPTLGPIVRGLVPFEFIVNSGMAQRAYFLDYWGGLWSWGRQKTDPDSSSYTYQYRMDSSDLSTWTEDGEADAGPGIRLVAKDRSGSLLAPEHYSEALYTTFPAPFRISSFPGAATTSASPVPATVGIAMVSGDRYNPLDYNYTSTSLPTNHRLSVIFDRQDSLRWGTKANPIVVSDTSSAMLDAYSGNVSYQYGDAAISPGNSSYYLAPSDTSSTKFGYIRRFPTVDASTKLVSKGINAPVVVSGSLYYSYFTPTEADVCTGGSGYTYSNLICDVLNPLVEDNRTTVSCRSGFMYTWLNIASDYALLGTRGVVQMGTVASSSGSGDSTTMLQSLTITGEAKEQYPKPRAWRTVH